MQLLLCFVDSLPILAVDDKNETLRSGVVVPPKRPDLILAANIPHVEFHIFIRNRLDIEAHCRTKLVSASGQISEGSDTPVGIVVTD